MERVNMDPERGSFILVFALAAALIGIHAHAHAQSKLAAVEAMPGIDLAIPSIETAGPPAAVPAPIEDAVRDLEQAALQSDFSSTERQLTLLQRARDTLRAVVKRLQGGVPRDKAVALLADLDHALQRASNRLGPLTPPSAGTFGPQVPSHNQLAQLASAGQDLVRDAPTVHHLLDGNGLRPMSQPPVDVHRPAGQFSSAPSSADLLSWPPDKRATWSQIKFHF